VQGVQRAVLVGQSMGGNIAQEVVFRQPERVAALVAVGCACNTLPSSVYQRAILAVTSALLRLMPERLLWAGTVGVSERQEVRAHLSATVSQLRKRDILALMGGTLRGLHAEPGTTCRAHCSLCRASTTTRERIGSRTILMARSLISAGLPAAVGLV